VIPFLSDIEEWVDSLTPEREKEVLDKFGMLEGESVIPYVYVPNQFWRHKNHRTAFRGFAEYRRRHPDSRMTLVCTGNTREYRFASFFESLMQDLKSLELGDSVKILSFLERQEQMVILKNCRALLQPSLFEGWGTGVQEAKRFAKPLLLSDIPIHREQGDDRSLYFLPLVPTSMADALDALDARSFVSLAPSDMKSRYYSAATEYSKDAHLLAEH
jgi:glycosyltransferase involved in cell wall biosynthesis